MMAMNLRGRVKEFGADFAGNYIWSIPCGPEQLGNLKTTLQKQPYQGAGWPSLKSVFSSSSRLSILTNWSSFYHFLVLDGQEPIGHFPIAMDVVPFDAVGIIFNYGKDDLRILVCGFEGGQDME
jgi:hypothetical protein